MKNASAVFVLLLLGMTLILAGCEKDDPSDEPPVTQPETSLTFTVKDDSIPLAGVLIGITPNQSDRDNGNFLRNGTTLGTGKYKFSPLTPNIYYYSVNWNDAGTSRIRTGAIEVLQDVKETVLVTY